MKKETKQKRGEILAQITREEAIAFDRISHGKNALMDLLTDLNATSKDLWDALRKKYKLEDQVHMVIDKKGNVIRKIF